MQKIDRLILILVSLILLIGMSSVCAHDLACENIAVDNDEGDALDVSVGEESIIDIEDTSDEDILHSNFEDLKSDDVKSFVVNQRNFKMYFDDHNILKEDYAGQIMVFDGKFQDKGIITIGSSNTKVTGRNTLFNNTVFCLESTNITLSNLNFVLDKAFPLNDYAGVLVLNDNNTIYNCNIDYVVPQNDYGNAILVECGSFEKVTGVTLVNNTINVRGNNVDDGSVYGVFIDRADNAVVYGNTINAYLPLKAVDWSREIYGGASMDTVAAFASQYCENLTLSNNHITTKATHRGKVFPTLDTVLIYDCDHAVIEYNYIYSEDYVTLEGQDNYLQGIDLYISDNVTIIGNQIHMRTTGGSEIMGTAYDIQVTGPSRDVKIAYNNLSSVNNGPNLGIYSQNFYGATELQIISNTINISGIANKHYWALVAGIEVQDTNDLIWNNTIVVNNLGDYDDDNNIYGISYSQNTNNNHSYNIQYNNVITNGRYAISLAGTTSQVVDSVIANNMLKTRTLVGDDAVRVGKGVNNRVYGNSNVSKSLDYNDLPDWLKNHKTLNPFVAFIPISDDIFDNEDIVGYGGENNNPGAPGHNRQSDNLKSNSIVNIGGDNVKTNLYQNGTTYVSGSTGSDDYDSFKIGGELAGIMPSGSAGADDASASESKSYEVTKVIEPEKDYFLTVLILAIAVFLLIIGYRRKNNGEEY